MRLAETCAALGDADGAEVLHRAAGAARRPARADGVQRLLGLGPALPRRARGDRRPRRRTRARTSRPRSSATSRSSAPALVARTRCDLGELLVGLGERERGLELLAAAGAAAAELGMAGLAARADVSGARARRSVGRPAQPTPLKPGRPRHGSLPLVRGPATDCGVPAALPSAHVHLARIHAGARRARQPRSRQPHGRRGGGPADRDREDARRLLLAGRRRPRRPPRPPAAARRRRLLQRHVPAGHRGGARRAARRSRAPSSSSASTSCSRSSTSRPSTPPPRGAWVSKAWAPLFARKDERGILALQFAIAGMNAHINNDLAHALVLTWHELGLEPPARQRRVPRLREGQRDPRARRGRAQGPARPTS